MAATHKIYIDPTSVDSIQGNPGEEISLPLLFEPSDSKTSTGIQFFIHYASSSLTPLAPADLAADIFANTWDTPEADTDNADTDSSTDKNFELNWLSFMGNFPGGETTYPTKIATLKFKISENLTETSAAPTLNFTAGQMASGYTFEGTSITLGDESEEGGSESGSGSDNDSENGSESGSESDIESGEETESDEEKDLKMEKKTNMVIS